MMKCILGLLLFASMCRADKESFVIGCRADSGLFSNFLGVVNNLIWCEKCHKIPIVFWNECSLYFTSKGFQGKNNVWEYYFQPISNLIKNPEAMAWPEYYAPDHSQIKVPIYSTTITYQERVKVSQIIKKYIRMQPWVEKKVNEFYQQYLKNRPTIGIHLRGTDKDREMHRVSFEVIIKKAQEVGLKYGANQFFIATDEQSLLDRALSALPGQVIYYPSYRSKNGVPIHYDENLEIGYTRAQAGEDVVVEVFLLSMCDYLIHTSSNVSAAVLYLNPDLTAFYLH